MAEKKSLVETTLLQMKELENVISENAKGILQSTMKEEIGELVKESLKEQAEPEMDDEVEVDDTEMDSEDEDEVDFEDDSEIEMDDEPIDLTGASDEEILKVFKGMGEDDGIIIKKDGNTIDLEDTNEDVEYKIHMGESEEEFSMDDYSDDYSMEGDYSDEEQDFMPLSDDEMFSESEKIDHESDEEIVYEIEMDEESEEESEEGEVYETEMDEESEEEVVYETEIDEESEEESEEEVVYEIGMDEELDETEHYESDTVEEGFKPKGKGTGKPKFKYGSKPNQQGGFKEKMKQGPKSVGTGKPKFKYGEGENAGSKLGNNKIVKKSETKEASRTLGTGKYFGKKGLPKPKAAPRHLRVESQENELNLLREKNEEYRKALNLFRGKLNEVAVFNSNLAYATRLFTEHSTTKQEKINILRRFDGVETLKESKALYKTIKDELSSQNNNKPTKESIQEQIERTPASGSAVSLIESKTYENPQFMRMKDLMIKMNIK